MAASACLASYGTAFTFEGFPDFPLGDVERLCLAHGLLPSMVGPWPQLNNAAPSVQLHYRAFFPVESGEVGLIALPPPARSNGSCSFPASRFPMWVALIGEGWVVFQGRGRSAARGRSLR